MTGDQASAAARLNTHEAVCAERYEGILSRLSRLEKLVIFAVLAMLGGMGSLILYLGRLAIHLPAVVVLLVNVGGLGR